mmetsp:Transcript_48793/g.93320  ORF Transcript_48793/g.93320 Transcript_48793/m.93320 type:complete len:175 (-) Transcript_48793:260-784(-)
MCDVYVLNFQDENSALTVANKAEVETTFADSEAVLAEQIRVQEGMIQKLEESICAEKDTVQTHADRILDIQIDIQKLSSIVNHDEESLSVLERRVASTEANRRENGIEFKQELQKMDQRLHKNEVYIEGLQKLEDKVQKAWKETTELQRIVRVLSREGDVEAELYARKLALEYT